MAGTEDPNSKWIQKNLDKLDDIYGAGWEARMSDAKKKDCPYTTKAEKEAWLNGFKDAGIQFGRALESKAQKFLIEGSNMKVGDRVKIDVSKADLISQQLPILKKMLKNGGDGKLLIRSIDDYYAQVSGWEGDAALGTLRVPLKALKESTTESKAKQLINVLEASGSGWGKFKKGLEIKSIDDLSKDDIILSISTHFDNAKNVVKILKVFPDKAYGIFVNPEDTSKLRMNGDREFVIWDFQLGGNREYFKIKQ
jgi:ribosome modulation factor